MLDQTLATVWRGPDPGLLGEVLGLVAEALPQPRSEPTGIGAIEIVKAVIGLLVSHTSSSIRHGLASR